MIPMGFRFGDTYTSNHGMISELVSMPLRSEPKTVYTDIAGKDGELNLNFSNSKKRFIYRPRIIEFMCHCYMHEDASIANELYLISDSFFKHRDEKLILDSDPNYYYKAHVANLFNVTFETQYSFSFPLIFKCDPFVYTKFTQNYSGENEVVVQNDGYYTNSIIEVSGSAPYGFTLQSSQFPDKFLTVNMPLNDTTAIIDTEKMDVTINGVSCLSHCQGEFFELEPGFNHIMVSGNSTDVKINVAFDLRFV